MRTARMLAATLMVSGVLLLAACGTKDNGGAIVPSGTTPTTAAPSGGAKPSGSPYP